MAAIHETAYPRLTENVTVAALQQVYSPSEREIVWSKTHRLNTGSRLLILVLLKCFQRLGYFPRIRDIPQPIIAGIAKTLNCSSADWLSNVPSSTQSRLQIKVRLFVNVTKYSVEEHSEWLKEKASQLAMTKENTIDIINALLEYLIKEQLELPCGPQIFNHSLSNHDLIVMMKPAKYWCCDYSISRFDYYWQPHNVCARFGNPGRNTGSYRTVWA